MSAYGGNRRSRVKRRDIRRRHLRVLAYMGLAILAVGTATVVVLALQK